MAVLPDGINNSDVMTQAIAYEMTQRIVVLPNTQDYARDIQQFTDVY